MGGDRVQHDTDKNHLEIAFPYWIKDEYGYFRGGFNKKSVEFQALAGKSSNVRYWPRYHRHPYGVQGLRHYRWLGAEHLA